MTRKLNFLVIAVFFVLFILIVNAAEEVNGTYNQSNESSSYSTTTLEVEVLANETSNLSNSNEVLTTNNDISQTVVIENKETGKSVTASFGVYLEIIG